MRFMNFLGYLSFILAVIVTAFMNFLGYLSFILAVIVTTSFVIYLVVQQIIVYRRIIEKARKFVNNKNTK
jgi:hypothetical protein